MNENLFVWKFYLSTIIFIIYLIYAIVNKRFLAFTLSKKYWISLCFGVFTGTFLGVLLGNIVSLSQDRLGVLFYLKRIIVESIATSILFTLIFLILLSLVLIVIFTNARDMRNVTATKTNIKKYFSLNVLFMVLMFFLIAFVPDSTFLLIMPLLILQTLGVA